jgi:hypothetical protein
MSSGHKQLNGVIAVVDLSDDYDTVEVGSGVATRTAKREHP